ncbi:MAG TPA: fumarylacetoacetate hydrolase family protein [Frankiaceae bacterium]|nr:fumarylacetoacetate hydrolase family protein [Frankiaceae bacterium]
MRIARVSVGGSPRFGVVNGGLGGSSSGELLLLSAHPFGELVPTGERAELDEETLLAPILPSKVIGIGRNYAEHAREMGGETTEEPLIFLKPSTSVIGPGKAISMPATRVDFEGELAVVIGRLCSQVPAARAFEVILGYTCGNDVTARDWQRDDGQWTRAKGGDTFCPLGPWIETELDPTDLAIRTYVDGEVRQDGRTSQLIHAIPELIEYVSTAMTLLPGDVILTGTPAGIGPLQAGQSVSVEIEGIGMLTNVAEPK